MNKEEVVVDLGFDMFIQNTNNKEATGLKRFLHIGIACGNEVRLALCSGKRRKGGLQIIKCILNYFYTLWLGRGKQCYELVTQLYSIQSTHT